MNDVSRPLRGNPSNNLMRKVTSDEVIEIRRRYAEGGVSYRALGDEYGLTGQSVSNIVSRSSWAWLDDEDARLVP